MIVRIWFAGTFFRRLVRYRHVGPSIRVYGADRYLADIAEARERVPQMLTIPGVECLPYYRWEEDFSWATLTDAWQTRSVGKVLRLRGVHRRLLAIGMSEAEDYEGIPSPAQELSKHTSGRMI